MVDEPVIARAAELIEAHQDQQAAYLLSNLLQKNPLSPESIPAWLLLTRVVDSDDKKIDCLQRVLQIDPGNQTALEMLKRLKGEQPFILDSREEIRVVPSTSAEVQQAPQAETGTIPEGQIPVQSVEPQPAFVGDEIAAPAASEIPPELKNAIERVRSIEEYFADVKPVTEKFQGTMGPDFLKLQGLIREWVSSGYILQVEEYLPQKMFGKPEIKFTFAKPKDIFQGYCHDYPYICSKYNAQESYLEFNIENIVGEHLFTVYRSLEKREAGLELLRIFTPDHKLLRSMAVVREVDKEHQVVDLYWGNRSIKIGEISRNPRQGSEVVNNADGKPLLRLVDHSGKDPKRVAYTIQKDTSTLRYQIRAFDYSSREMLLRVGDPHKMSEYEEAAILMTGLLAVDYMV